MEKGLGEKRINNILVVLSKALKYAVDCDLIAKPPNGLTTTPKGRTRRTIPMTSTLEHALRRLETVRDGFVVRSLDGRPKTDGEADHTIERICRRAGLPVRYWHTLRHTFGTHAALFGVVLRAEGIG